MRENGGKNEKFEREYPFLIVSPRVPMEEEIGISKEEVLVNYEKFILNDLFHVLKKMEFKQRGKTSMFYRCLSNGIMVSIDLKTMIPYIKDKLNDYENLIKEGKEACMFEVQEREIKKQKEVQDKIGE